MSDISWIFDISFQGDNNSGRYGNSVGIDCSRAIVGAPYDNSGSAYLYKYNDISWVFDGSFQGDNPGDQFGFSVGIDGRRAIIGAPYDNSGSAYLYKYNDISWVFDGSFQGDNAGDYFGWSVGIDGSRAIVGAHYNTGPAVETGAVYFYERNDISWVFDGSFQGDNANDYLGESVSIDGNRAIAGVAKYNGSVGTDGGAAYFYEYNDISWVFDVSFQGENANDNFGRSVSVDGSRAIVGADGNNSNTGAAYFYEHNDISWVFDVSFQGENTGDIFGDSVSIYGGRAIVGAFRVESSAGAAYFYEHNNASWIFDVSFQGENAGDEFGNSVDIDSNRAIVGALMYNSEKGAAYFYELPMYLSATAYIGGEIVYLSWTGGYTPYTLYYKKISETSWEIFPSPITGITTTTYTVNNLSNNTPYEFYIYDTNCDISSNIAYATPTVTSGANQAYPASCCGGNYVLFQQGSLAPTRKWTRANNSVMRLPSGTAIPALADARRKAEVLKYNSNANNSTKAQKWSNLASGKFGRSTSNNTIPGIGNILWATNIPTEYVFPPQASDVPGSWNIVVNKILRETPLINYKVQRTYKAGNNSWPENAPGGRMDTPNRPVVTVQSDDKYLLLDWSTTDIQDYYPIIGYQIEIKGGTNPSPPPETSKPYWADWTFVADVSGPPYAIGGIGVPISAGGPGSFVDLSNGYLYPVRVTPITKPGCCANPNTSGSIDSSGIPHT